MKNKSVKKTKKCMACRGKGYVYHIAPTRYKVTEEQKPEILKLYRKGLGIREIGRRLNIPNPYSVSYVIKTANRII